MSRSIDERIVEMKFNNKDFERNASETMSTLDKLKAKLKFDGATKGIEEIERAGKKFNLDGMGDATDVVVKKFDFMATAAFTVMNRIVDKAIDTGERLVKSLSLDQISAGWEKYNSKVASVQTIVNATGLSTETIEKYLSKLMWYSDETSYSFSEMVSALGQMTSAGGDINKLIPMIMGIANAAAYAGKIGEPFVHAIRNINQSYSMGYLNLQDWKSVELAGVNSKALMETLIKYGYELGTITEDMGEITASNFRTSLADKWATKEVMEAAFGEFASMTEAAYKMVQEGEVDTASEAYAKLAGQYGAIAERAALAAQEAKTFEEAIDATKDAVSTKWLNIFDTIIGSYDEAKRLWTDFANDLWDVFAGPMDDKQATLDQGLTSGLTRFVREKALNTELLVEAILKQIDKFDKEAIEAAVNGDYGIIDTLEGVGNRAGKIRQAINDYGLGEAFMNGGLSAEELAAAVHDVHIELDKMIGDWVASGAEVDQEVQDYAKGFTELDLAIQNGELDGEKLKLILADINRESGRANLVDALKAGWQALFKVSEDTEGNITGATGLITVFKKALSDVFPAPTSEQIYKFTERIKKFAEGLILTKDQAKGLRNIINGLLQPFRWLADGIKVVWGWIKSVFEWGNGKLRKAFEWFSDIKNIGDFIHKIFGDERYVRLTAAWNTISEKLGNAWKKISDALGKIFGKDKETSKFVSFWQKIKDNAAVVAGWILDRIVDLVELIASIDFEKIAGHLASYFETAWAWLATAYLNVKKYIENLHLDQVAQNVWSWIVTAYGDVRSFVENFTLEGFIQKFKDAWEAIKNFFMGKNPDGSEKLPNEGDTWIVKTIKAIGEKIKEVWAPASEFLANISAELTPGKIAVIVFGIAVIKMLTAVTKAAKGIAGIGDAFYNISKGLKSIMKGLGQRLRPNYIRELSIAIITLTVALTIFYLMDPNRLLNAGIALGAVIAVFIGAVAALAFINKKFGSSDPKDKSMNKLAAMIGLLSASLLLLAAATAIISTLNLERIWEKLGAFALVVGIYLGSILLLSKFAPQISKGMSGLLFMSASLLILSIVINALTAMPIENAIDAIPKVLIMIGMLFLLARVLSGSSSTAFAHKKGVGTSYASSKRGLSTSGAIGMFVVIMDLLVLSAVLKKLAKEPISELIRGVVAFIPLFVVITLLAIAMRIAGKQALGAGVGMLAIGAAMLVLGVAIKYIGSIKTEEIKRGTLAIVALLAMTVVLLAFSKKTHTVAEEKSNFLQFAGAMIIISVAMIALSAAIRIIGGMRWDQALIGTAAAVAILAMFVLMMKQGSKLQKTAGSLFLISLIIAELVAAIALLTTIPMNQVLPATIAVGSIMLRLAKMLKVMPDTESWSEFGRRVGMALTSIGMFIAITYVLAKFMQYTSNIKPEAILAAAGSISVVMIALAGMLRIMPAPKTWNDLSKTIVLTIAGIGLLYLFSLAIGELSKNIIYVDITSLGAVMAAFVATMLVLALATKALSSMHLSKDFWTSFGGFAALTGFLIVLINGISALYSIPGYEDFINRGINAIAENLGKISLCMVVAVEMIALLGLITGVMRLLGDKDVKDLYRVELAFAALAGFLLLLINAISALYAIPGYDKFIQNGMEGIATNLGNISLCMLAVIEMLPILAGLALIARILPSGAETAIFTAELALGALILGLSVIIIALAALQSIPGFDEFIQKGYKMLQDLGKTLGYFIGEFIGGIFGGIAIAITESMIIAIDNIGIFVKHLQPVLDSISALSMSTINLDNLGILANAILQLTAANLLDQISGLIGSSLDYDKLGTALEGFAEHIGNFGDVVSQHDFDPDKMDAATEAAKNLAEFINYLPREGGFLQSIIGEAGDLSKFSAGVEAYGNAITTYDTVMKEHIAEHGPIDEAVLSSTINAGKMLAELQNAIPRTGGWAQQILGESDMKKFAWGDSDGSDPKSAKGGIVGFANAICAYDDILKDHGGIDEEVVSSTARMGTMLAELNAAIPETGGTLQTFLGSKDLEAFSGGEDGKGGIVKFATAICDYDDILAEHGSLDERIITTSVRMGELLAKLWSFLPTSGGAIKWFTGQQATLEDFAAGITALGAGLGTFYDEVKDIQTPDKFNDAMEGLIYLVTAWNMITGSFTRDEVANMDIFTAGWNWITSGAEGMNAGTKITTFKLIGEALVELADYLVPFAEKMEGINLESIHLIGEAMMDLGYSLMVASDLEPSAVDNLIASIQSLASMEIDAYKETLSENQTAMHEATTEMYTNALTMSDGEKQGLLSTVKSSISDLAGNVSDDIFSMLMGPFGSNKTEANISVNANAEVSGNGNDFTQTLLSLVTGGSGDAGSSIIQNLFGNIGSSENMSSIASSLGGLFSPDTNGSLMSTLTGSGEGMFDSLLSGFSSSLTEEGALSGIYGQFGDVFSGDIGTEFGDILSADGSSGIQTYLDGMLSGISSNETSVDVTNIVSSLSDAIKQKTDEQLPSTGEYAVDGFIRGISKPESIRKLKEAGNTVGDTFEVALRHRLDEHSPSKVAEHDGEYVVVGFVKGILESMYMAKDAADELGISTVDAMSAAVSYAYAAAISDYDFKPTISPVLDLSEVRATANQMDSLFGMEAQIKMAGINNDLVNSYVAKVRADTASVNAALDALQTDISQLNERFYGEWQPDLEGAIERGFSNVSVNLDGKKVGKMNVDYQNRQSVVRGRTQIK